ncbi:MAG: CoA-binding protein [Candidatus Gracilibacteria bacterium]|nr:CoA-binding protein [Candidatus Gracilibacteria bacterium]
MKIVLIGASNNGEKFGNKILKDLISKGHEVIPVNPNEEKIEGIKTHKILKTVPKNFDIINFVVPDNITLQILKKYSKLLQNKKVWIQPGAENDEVKKFLEENDFTDFIVDSCIMFNEV